MDKLPETINKILDVFAEKFGTKGEALWLAILTQQKINGTFNVIYAFAIGIFGTILGIYLLNTDYAWTGYIVFFCVAIGTIAVFQDAFTAFINPTYSAIEDILSKIKKDNSS